MASSCMPRHSWARSALRKTSSANGMNQRANAALAGCAASPLPWWPSKCVSAHMPQSVFLASGRMMFLHHNQVHLKSFRSNAQVSAEFIASPNMKLFKHLLGHLWWEFFFHNIFLSFFFLTTFTNSRVVALGDLLWLTSFHCNSKK